MSTLVDLLSEKLKLEILSGIHPPGTRLPPERVLSAQNQINRNSVREAIKRLEQLGLVEIRHGSGTHVRDFEKEGGLETLSMLLAVGPRELSEKTLRDAMEFRVTYAAGIVELATERCTGDQAERLVRSLNDMKAASDAAEWMAAERRFMSIMLEAADNRIFVLLQNTLAKTFKQSSRFIDALFAHRDDVERSYQKVLKAISARQTASAVRYIRDLVLSEKEWLLAEGSKNKGQTGKR